MSKRYLLCSNLPVVNNERGAPCSCTRDDGSSRHYYYAVDLDDPAEWVSSATRKRRQLWNGEFFISPGRCQPMGVRPMNGETPTELSDKEIEALRQVEEIVHTRRAKSSVGPLDESDRRALSQSIVVLVGLGQDRARDWINHLLWFWTADGVDGVGEIVRDGLKYSPREHRSTQAARDALERGEPVIHEHMVPRKILLDWLGEERPLHVVHEALVRLNRAALVTPEEDVKLNAAGLRERMPDGWSPTDGPCDARYLAVGVQLDDALGWDKV